MIARRARAASADVRPLLPRVVFTVPGRPIPLERARVYRNTLPSGKKITRSITPDKSGAYRTVVQLHMNAAAGGTRRSSAPWPWRTTAPIRIAVSIFWADAKHGDGSNMVKAIEDAGNGLLWHDDKQIVEGSWRSTIDRAYPRVEVVVEVVDARECIACGIWRHLGKPCPEHDDGRGLEVVG